MRVAFETPLGKIGRFRDLGPIAKPFDKHLQAEVILNSGNEPGDLEIGFERGCAVITYDEAKRLSAALAQILNPEAF